MELKFFYDKNWFQKAAWILMTCVVTNSKAHEHTRDQDKDMHITVRQSEDIGTPSLLMHVRE